MDKRYDKRTRRTRGRPESGNTHQTTQKDTKKYIKRENASTLWNTWILVQEIHLHSRQTSTRNEEMPTRCTIPDWMTKGKATLIQNDPSKGTAPNNYRLITCLPMKWTILTAQIREKIYYSLTSRGLFPDEQKGCWKGSRGTAELLYIDQHILNESKNRRKNLSMAWIDYKKAYDMVPHSWIINSLKMYKISHETINFIEKKT